MIASPPRPYYTDSRGCTIFGRPHGHIGQMILVDSSTTSKLAIFLLFVILFLKIVWVSVWVSVWASVWASVWESVWESVWASV